MAKQNIMVTGATGQQGGSVVNVLLENGHQVHALTRNPDSDKAKALSARGVKMVAGDMGDPDSLGSVFDQVDSLFLVGTPFEAGVEGEVSQGINAIDAAKSAGIKHILYSSVSDADKNTAIPHFDSKFEVEQHLSQSGVPFSIMAPAFFYDNMMAPFILPGLQTGALAQAMPADVPLQSVSIKNIGEFAGLILDNPERFRGQRINIASDNLNGDEYAGAIEAASGKKLNYVEVPLQQVKDWSEDMASMYDWFVRVGYSADIEGLKNRYPEVKWESFSEWASRQDWGILKQ